LSRSISPELVLFNLFIHNTSKVLGTHLEI